MKISTSASFVVASLALSSSGLALPTPDSPDLTASPKSAKVAQMADFADSTGEGSPVSRRVLPRRGLRLRDTDESYDDKTTESITNGLGSLSMLMDKVENDLQLDNIETGLGFRLDRLKAKRDAYASPDLSARQVPPNTPQPPAFLPSPPPFPQVPAPVGVPAPVAGASGIPGMAAGQVYPYYGMVGSNVPFSPPVGPGQVQGIAGSVPMAAEHAAEGGFPLSQGAPFSPMAMIPGPVGQTIQNTPAGGVVNGVPVGTVAGLPGQAYGVPYTIVSTAGQIAGNAPVPGSVPGPAGAVVQGLPNPAQQVSNVAPVGGLMSDVPFFGAEQARNAASVEDASGMPGSPSSTVATPSSSPTPSDNGMNSTTDGADTESATLSASFGADPTGTSSPPSSPQSTDSPVSSPNPTDSGADTVSTDPTASSSTTGDASEPSDTGAPLLENVEEIPSAPVSPPNAPTELPSHPGSAPSPPAVPVPLAPPSVPVVGAPAPPTNGTAGAPSPPALPSPPSAPVRAKRDATGMSLPPGFPAPSLPIPGDMPILLGTGAKDASDPADPSSTDDTDISASATVGPNSSDPSATDTDTGVPPSPTSSVGSASSSDQNSPLLPSPTGSPTASGDAPAPTTSTLTAAKKRMSRFFRFSD